MASVFFFSSRRRHTTWPRDWSSDVCSSDLEKDVLEVKTPAEAHLPRPNVSSTFIFAKEDHFFLYPNNYNYYHNYYKNTFQHGGISLEEMICPFIRMVPK